MGSRLLTFFLPIFGTPTTYALVLQRLAGCAFWETYITSFFLRDIPEIGAVFRSAESYGSLGTIIAAFPHPDALNISGLVIALTVALLTRAVRLHDRISDMLGIRKRFDQKHILFPLAALVGQPLTATQREAVIAKQHDLMRDLFYRYSSSRADNPLVDKHEIEHALDSWSWFWVCIEAVVLFAVAGVIALLFNAHQPGVWLFIVGMIFASFAVMQYPRLGRYAKIEISAIAADSTAARDVRARLNALSD
jgi:hypothetical protein